MLLALLKRIVLEIVFCFTYCKMNQRFILWRLLFCWYIQYDRYIYIEYVCYLYLMQYVNVMMISGWLFMFSRRHEQCAARSDQVELQATSLLIQTFKTNFFQLFMQMSCQQHQRRQLPAAGDYGKCFWKHFPPWPVSCCSFKGSPSPMKI